MEKSFASLSYGNCSCELFCLQIDNRQNHFWVCVCEWETGRERDREREKERVTGGSR